MRLKDEDYFQYGQALRQRRQSATTGQIRSSVPPLPSYDALLQGLDLNDLADSAAVARIEAHYTFLGRFLHPTHNAVRDLHEQSNVHDGKTRIGMGQTYAETAELLAYLYVCCVLASSLDEVAGLFDAWPRKRSLA